MQTVSFKGRDIQVDELTVSQLEQALQAAGEDARSGGVTAIDNCFLADFVTEEMLLLATGLGSEDLRSVRPSELVPVVEAFKAQNEVFLAGLRKTMARGEAR